MKKLNKLTATILSTILVLSTGTVNAFAFDGEQDIKTADSVSVNNPVYHEGEWNGEYHTLSVPDYTDWSYVYFGSYPQSEVKDAAIINQIDAKLAAQNLTVGDVWIGNIKYRKISPENADCTIRWDNDKDYTPDKAFRYFKWERIKWKVLNIDKTTNKLFLWSDMALDCNKYEEKAETVTWETSSLRSFLNSGEGFNCKKSIDYGYNSKDKGFSSLNFYSTAFSQEEHKMIQRSLSVGNGFPQYPLISGGNDADDLVFLLSYDEITNPKYGFADAEHYWLQSESRRVVSTDYALAMGSGALGFDFTYGNDHKNTCAYWLRNSIGQKALIASFTSVNSSDGASIYGNSVNGYGMQGFGVVPAINIIYSSDISTITKNDGTSGSGGSIASKEEVEKKAAEEAKKEEEKQEKATLSLSLTGKITKLKKDSVTVKFTNKTPSSVSIKTNDSKFKKKKTIKIKPGKSKSVKLKLKSKKLKKKKLKLKFKCSYAGKTYKITVNSKKVTVK